MLHDKKPTPLRKRATAKRPEPKPLIFPQPDRNITVVNTTSDHTVPIDMAGNPIYPTTEPLTGIALRNFIAHCIARTLYKVADLPEAEIIYMGESQFEAFCRSVLEGEE